MKFMTQLDPEKHLDIIQRYNNNPIQDLHDGIKQALPDDWVLVGQIAMKCLLLVAIYVALDFVFRKIILQILKKYTAKSKNPWMPLLVKHGVFASLMHIIPTLICYELLPYIFYHHPYSFEISYKILQIGLLLILMQLIHRLLQTVEDYYSEANNYKSLGISSFVQLIRIVSFIIIGFIIISILFDISPTQILTVIGAVAAVFVLVFRDPILGFVAGIHASSSKLVKLGDWVYFPKYNLEGYVKEIDLISVKIEGFDNAITSIPTYDLISAEMRNNEAIVARDKRMIKRSIFLNINSFQFLKPEDLEHYKSNPLLVHYISKKQADIELAKKNAESNDKVYEKRLTNVGLFRVYIHNYLHSNPKIDKNEILMVRQKESSTQGLPIEIFCFANTAKWTQYEAIQSDVFDFVLTSAKEFGLEVVQAGVRV